MHEICYQHAAYVLGGRVGMGEAQRCCARCEKLDSYSYSLLIYTPVGGGQHVKVTLSIFSSFPSKDSHEVPLKRNVFSSFLSKLSFLPKGEYTLWKLSHYCVDMVAAEI